MSLGQAVCAGGVAANAAAGEWVIKATSCTGSTCIEGHAWYC
jgi:hypothetical protein